MEPFLTIPTQTFSDELLTYVSLYQHEKRLFH